MGSRWALAARSFARVRETSMLTHWQRVDVASSDKIKKRATRYPNGGYFDAASSFLEQQIDPPSRTKKNAPPAFTFLGGVL